MSQKVDGPPVLDPGISRRRRPGSPCKCLCYTLAALVAAAVTALGAYVSYLLLSKAASVVDSHRYPYKDLHYNETSVGEAVRPLIDSDATFDVVLSVWLRAPEEEEAAYLANNPAEPPGLEGIANVLGDMLDFQAWTSGNTVHNFLRKTQDSRLLEAPLFSDVVFKDARLSDRGRTTAITLRIPTARFLTPNLTATDLRATFMVIPSSPSAQVSNYSSWKPKSVALARPTRAWPFPLGAEDAGEKSVEDLAFESFSITVPMVRFHEVNDPCGGANRTKSDDGAVTNDDTDGKDEVKNAASEEPAAVNSEAGERTVALSITPEPPYKKHPHIVTRAQLRIVDSAPVYQKKGYAERHANFANDPCSMNRMSFQPVWPFCDRSFANNGHFEAYVELKDTEQSEWRYAPYIDIRNSIAGPRDIIPVPVVRQKCETDSARSEGDESPIDATPAPEFMDITLHVDFSGETPGRSALATLMTWQSPPLTNESEYVQVMAHDNAELWNSVRGHYSREDARPRLRIALTVLSALCYLAVFLFDFTYWYKCSSTVTISIHATEMLIAAGVVSYVDSVVTDTLGDPENWWIHALMYTPELLLPFLMAKAIYRWEFGWRDGKGLKRWIPTAKQVPAGHRERASVRLDKRVMGDKATLGLLAGSLLLSLLMRDTPFLQALHPTPDEAHKPNWSSFTIVFGHMMNTFFWAGHLRQGLLRHSVRRFAGQYRLGAVLMCLATWTDFLGHLTSVVGHYDARPAYHYVQLPGLALTVWAAYQAFTLVPEPVDDATEDEE